LQNFLCNSTVVGMQTWTAHHRLGRLVALAVGAFLLPWCAVLGATLPASAHVPNWSLAWVGLDLAEAVAALFTAVLLTRGSPRAGLSAAAGAALLLADAWFDLCTSPPGLDRLLAVVEAVLVELPLAAAAIWLAVALTRPPRRPVLGHGPRRRPARVRPRQTRLDLLGHGQQHGRILQRFQAVRRVGQHQQVAVPAVPGVLARRQPDPAGQDVHARLPGALVLGQARAADHSDDGLAEHLLVAADDGGRGAAPAPVPGTLE
jgi:hypothetical protein